MDHPTAIRPEDHAVYRSDKMGKATLFRSDRMLVGLNAFEPGQEHALHAHAGMDKVYQVIEARECSCLTARPSRCRRASCWQPRTACPTASATPAPGACSSWPFWRRRRNRSPFVKPTGTDSGGRPSLEAHASF